MIPLINNKWRNVTILGCLLLMIILIFEVFPLISNSSEQIWAYASALTSIPDIEELKHAQTYNRNHKKHLTSIKKEMYVNSLKNSSNATLIRDIDSLGKQLDCQLVSVMPISTKGGSSKELLQLKFSADYGSIYKLLNRLKSLPAIFTIRDISFSNEDDREEKLITLISIEFMHAESKKL